MSAETTPTRFSVIVPVYKNEASIPALLERLAETNRELGGELEAVFVVDGSPDNSYALLRQHLGSVGFRSQLALLSRNFGSFAAIRQGLALARGPYFAVMAADLQEPGEVVVEFFRRLGTDEVDVIVGERVGRADPMLTSLTSRLFWWAYRRFVQPEVPPGGVDVFGCNRVVRDALLSLDESNSTLVGLLFWLGFRRESVRYERLARAHGRSGWSFRRKYRYLLDSAFSFTDLPIEVLTGVGAVGVLVSMLLAAVVLAMRLAGRIQVLGYTPLMLMLLLSTSTILFGLGIVGSYVWRTFENSKNRPLYVPLSHETFQGDDG